MGWIGILSDFIGFSITWRTSNPQTVTAEPTYIINNVETPAFAELVYGRPL